MDKVNINDFKRKTICHSLASIISSRYGSKELFLCYNVDSQYVYFNVVHRRANSNISSAYVYDTLESAIDCYNNIDF